MFLAIPTLAEQTTESEYVAVVRLRPKHYHELRSLRRFLKQSFPKAVLLRLEWDPGVLFDTNTTFADDANEQYSCPSDSLLHWKSSVALDPLVWPLEGDSVEAFRPAGGEIKSSFVDIREDGVSFRFRVDIGDSIEELIDTYTVTWKMLDKLFH